ncbi:hypothetical protein C6P45_000618 [Maudiozyma exigua]|uniref:Zn(2)-C6 fungal-type domain-containing protein n=1 Tax=Maudiozyma exigua TaxID=34358 RepID=A0A9P6W5K4_MAUEX|nr:hypothetical protein C6P45_000618 [Kazachstania exigua]
MSTSNKLDNKITKTNSNGSSRRRVNKACGVCRRRKVKCDGSNPCENCKNSGLLCSYENKKVNERISLYKQEDDIRKELSTLSHYRKNLESLDPSDTIQLRPLLSQIDTKLRSYRDNMRLTISKNQIENYNSPVSIETSLIETDYICFNRYDKINMAEASENLNDPSVGLYFGLYSASTLFSNGGFGWLFKKMFSTTLDQEETKKTFYLYLKFFDLSSIWFTQSMKQPSAPLAWCRKYYKYNLPVGSDNDLILDMIGDIKNVINDTEIDFTNIEVETPSAMLKKITLLMKKNKEFFTQLNTEFNALTLKQFFMVEEYNHLLFVEYFEKCNYALIYDTDIIESTLWYLDEFFWKEEYSTLSRTVSNIVTRAVESCYNRWEFYLGISETAADYKRNMWWKVNWWDKWCSLMTGKPTLVHESQIDCLLPRAWMECGIDETMDCKQLLDSLDFKRATEKDILRDIVYYILSKILDFCFVSILYNKKFTNYKMFSANCKNIDNIAKELLRNIENLESYWELLNSKLATYFDGIVGSGPDMDLSIIFSYAYSESIACAANLILRIISTNKITIKDEMYDKVLKLRSVSIHVCKNTVRNLLLVEDRYHHIKIINTAIFFLIRIVIFSIDNPDEDPLENIPVLVNFLAQFTHPLQNGKIFDIEQAYIYERQPIVTSLFGFIIVRIYLQTVLFTRNISVNTLQDRLKLESENALTVYNSLLNIYSPYFEPLLQEIEVSGMHLHVLDVINKASGSHFFENFKKPTATKHTNGNSIPNLFSVTPKEDLLSLVNLDDFLTLDIFPEVYEAIWQNFNTEPTDL